MLRPYITRYAPLPSDAQRTHLSRRGILRPQDNPHGVGIEIDIPAGDARPDEFLAVLRREPLGRRIEKLHQLHAHLEVRAAVAARGDADTDIVIELAADEALRHFEQPADNDALQHHAVLAAEAPRQHPGPGRIEAQGQELAPDLGMGSALALRLAVPLRLGAGGQVVPVQLEELGHRRVDVHPTGRRGTPPSGDEVRDVDLRHLNRIRQLARGALQLAQPAPYEFSNLDGALQGEGCRHVDSLVAVLWGRTISLNAGQNGSSSRPAGDEALPGGAER